MALTFSSKGTSNFKQCPAGTHLAVCDQVVFLGLQPGFGQDADPKPQIYIRFEIAALRVEYEKDGKQLSGPQVIGRTYTASMHKKANLRIMLESWRGKTFTEQEANEFDISKILGASAMIGVIQKESGGNIYSNIGTISGLPAGVPKPKLENPLVLYTGEVPADVVNLPEWLQKKILNPAKQEVLMATGSYAQPQNDQYFADAAFTDEQPPVSSYDDALGEGGDSIFTTDEYIPF
jgi:hypothetical protein